MSFEALTKNWQLRVHDKLDRVLPSADTSPTILHSAMRYAVLGGGKRIRPVLVYATGEALNVSPVSLDAPAAAIELMHAFSLVHDDLPAMDDDDLRRGRPTTHIKFGEANAILAADAMQPLAFKVLATDADMDCSPLSRLRIIDLLANACGSTGMTGGQAIDIQAEGKQLAADELENMYQLKTGLLLRTSVLAAAYCAEADQRTTDNLTHFIDCVGLAFQIRDDILDIEGTTDTIGKPQGSDQDRSKATWPALFGMQEAKQKTQDLLAEAMSSLAGLGSAADGLREVAHYIVSRDR
jgi:geranylgeranyl pyrophosphate synthase